MRIIKLTQKGGETALLFSIFMKIWCSHFHNRRVGLLWCTVMGGKNETDQVVSHKIWDNPIFCLPKTEHYESGGQVESLIGMFQIICKTSWSVSFFYLPLYIHCTANNLSVISLMFSDLWNQDEDESSLYHNSCFRHYWRGGGWVNNS